MTFEPDGPLVVDLAPDCEALRQAMAERDWPPVWQLDAETARTLNLEGNLLARAAWQPELATLSVDAVDEQGPVPTRRYRPIGALDADVTLVWLHGGGWVLGSLETADAICRSLAHLTGWTVVSVDYRVAPWHPFPAAFDDCRAVTARELARKVARGGRVVVGGDSAGGNLAGAVARDRDLAPVLAAQLLVYPATDPSLSAASAREFVAGPLLSRRDMEWFYAQYRGSDPAGGDAPGAGDPLVGDPRVDLTGPISTPVPPAVVLTVGHDPLRDEGVAYARELADRTPTRWIHAPELFHGAYTQAGILPSAWARVEESCRALVTLVTEGS
jgi:acetyl esterase